MLCRPAKCELVKTKFKFDDAIDYKTLDNDVRGAFRTPAPKRPSTQAPGRARL